MSNINDFVIEDGVLRKYIGTDGEVVIPDGVVRVGYRAFDGCNTIESVVFSESVTDIEDSAFENCRSLAQITIPTSVKTIGYRAFWRCILLADIYYQGGIEEYLKIKMGSSFFDLYSKKANLYINGELLTKVVIPKSVNSVGGWAFSWCNSLSDVMFESSDGSDGRNFFPLHIEARAFYNCNSLKNVTFGNRVSKIDHNAFTSCDALTSVIIPNSVNSIGDWAFAYCKALSSVTIGDSVIKLGESAFYGCEGVNTLVIGKGVEKIEAHAFYECKALTDVVIPDSVVSILEGAFGRCSSMRKITLLGTPEIHKNAFAGVPIVSVIAPKIAANNEGFTWWKSIFGDDIAFIAGLDNYVPDSKLVKQVKKNYAVAFNSIINLNRSDLFGAFLSLWKKPTADLVYELIDLAHKKGVADFEVLLLDYKATHIGEESIEKAAKVKAEKASGSKKMSPADCKKIFEYATWEDGICILEYKGSESSLVIPEFIGNQPVVAIGYKAFENCNSLVNISIPSSVVFIGSKRFDACTMLKYNEYDNALYLGNEENPFHVLIKAKDTKITSCKIHEHTKVIAESAFWGCASLTSIKIPESVTVIGEVAFCSCSSLVTINVPKSLSRVERKALCAGEALKFNEYKGGLYLGNDENPYLCFIKIKNENSQVFTMHKDTELAIDNAFEWCEKLKNVELSPKLKAISSCMFMSRTKLEEIEIPASVTSIMESAFEECKKLQIAVIPDSVKYISNTAFAKCKSVKFKVKAGSYTEQFAQKKKIEIVYM